MGRLLKPGDVVALYGELGAGKTVMTKGIAGAFGIEERDVVSASFTIVSEYNTVPPFVHVDLYRIAGRGEISELGLREHFGAGVSVIEWAEKAEDELPDGVIRVRLKSADEDTREIEIDGID